MGLRWEMEDLRAWRWEFGCLFEGNEGCEGLNVGQPEVLLYAPAVDEYSIIVY